MVGLIAVAEMIVVVVTVMKIVVDSTSMKTKLKTVERPFLLRVAFRSHLPQTNSAENSAESYEYY